MARTHVVAWTAAVAGIAITVSLGNWQLRRADEKRSLQARRDRAEAAAPMAVATAADLMAARDQLPRRVVLRGEFVDGVTVFLDNRIIEGKAGFQVVMPLRIAGDGTHVLIDRGWIELNPAHRALLPAIPRPDGTVELVGLAVERLPRLLELGTASPATVPGIWQNLDPDRYAKATGLAVAPIVVMQMSELPDGLQRSRARIGAGVDTHLGYAFQWYSLTALITVLAVVLGLRSRSRKKMEGAGGH
jgi:surfeit locus 1 family protein